VNHSRTNITLLGACLLLLPFIVSGHHSTGEYEQSDVVEIEGEVVEFTWRNPHVIVKVASTESGEEQVWILEGSSVSSQRRRGLSPDVLSIGDHVRVAGLASSRQPNHMTLEHLLLPSGEELLLRNARSEPRWPGSTVLGRETELDPKKVAAAQADGIYRVWSWGRLTPGWWFFRGPEYYSLTDAAKASLATYNEYEDNPVLKCVPPGMPATMGNPYPIEFVQMDGVIEIHSEEFDRVRTLHLDVEAPDDFVPSPLGFSAAHWEDENTLVIKTTQIDTPYFDRVGIPQSQEIEVNERFMVDDAMGQLHYDLVVTDPQNLAEPFEWRALWIWRPGEEVGEYKCLVTE
jgi:hypothetical protein